MGRAYRYQRRLTHITVSVAERGGNANLVTKVEDSAAEPVAAKGKAKAAPKGKTAGAKKPVAKKAAAKKSTK
jgi:large subunit ribosomal protein L22